MSETPTATVIAVRGGTVVVKCPYCGAHHHHDRRGSDPLAPQHRAPGCGMYRSEAERTVGYVFTEGNRAVATR